MHTYSILHSTSILYLSNPNSNPTHHPTPHQPHHYINRQFPRESRATQSKAKQHSVSKCKPIFPNHPRMKKKKKMKKKNEKMTISPVPPPFTCIYVLLLFAFKRPLGNKDQGCSLRRIFSSYLVLHNSQSSLKFLLCVSHICVYVCMYV